jgi:two-component system NtrC family sensor kinase
VDCPCYGKHNERCWQIAGTQCNGEPQGDFVEKYGTCSKCPVFEKATTGYSYQIGEHFNNMMSMLAGKHAALADSYEKLKASQQQIIQQEKMATIGQLSAGIAHEINNPVGYVSSNLASLGKYFQKLKEFIALQSEVIEAYEQGKTPPSISAEKKKMKIDYILEDVDDLTKESLEGCDRIRSITRDLKTFVRSGEDKQESVDLHEVIDKTLNVIWNEIKYKAKVAKKYGELPEISCYPNKLSQVFMNLIINASHAMEKEGTITITTWQEDGEVFVSIHDDGCGIPREDLENIFTAFFTTKEKGKGTGLGLSICKEIIEQHKGKIEVDSNLGEGTTFTLRIPVA